MPRLCKKVSTVVGRSLCRELGPGEEEVGEVGGGGGERDDEEEEDEVEEGERACEDEAKDLSHNHSSLRGDKHSSRKPFLAPNNPSLHFFTPFYFPILFTRYSPLYTFSLPSFPHPSSINPRLPNLL